MVGRGWGAAFDWAEFWKPKVRAADCLDPQAACSILPIAYLRARMVMAGRSKAEIVSAVKAAFENKQLRTSKQELLTEKLKQMEKAAPSSAVQSCGRRLSHQLHNSRLSGDWPSSHGRVNLRVARRRPSGLFRPSLSVHPAKMSQG
jgi:hypothetical protein